MIQTTKNRLPRRSAQRDIRRVTEHIPFALGLLLLLAFPFSAANGQSDLSNRISLCDSCHGKDGNSQRPEIPIIAGFSHDGFLDTIEAFRDESRSALAVEDETGEEKAMTEIALSLTDEEVEALAGHYASFPFQPAKQTFDPALAEKGKLLHEEKKCERCHSSGGSDPQDDAAILAGQWTPYLKRQIAHFKIGRRNTPKKMKRAVDSLSDEEVEALLHFYASAGAGGG